ncbi:MAG TPA: RNA polymerase sigma factor [Isosphaeraceae bacterium]|nr:RNA polymerase sigma factor [Isosphaeraceae bacterium]
MADRRRGADFPDIRALFQVGTTGDLTDEQLLEQFGSGDREAAEIAFKALVMRHGPMVLRICRIILRDLHDAEDAFQATFLVLARRAGSIRKRGSAASWLHGVARRVASCARTAAARRRWHEQRAAAMARRSVDDAGWDDLGAAIHEEIGRLSESCRAAVVLCDLEGLTEGQAARRLGWPIGTVRSRLMRGREHLRGRLTRRGLSLSAVMLGSLPAPEAASAAVPAALVNSTVQGALHIAAGGAVAAGTVPAVATTLTHEVLKAMFLTKLKLSAAALLAVGAASSLAIVTVGFTQEKPAAAPPTTPATPPTTPVSPRTQAILAKLEKPIPMVFPQETPLDDLLKYIQQTTRGGPNDPQGLPIYVDPLGLQEARRSLNSTFTINLEGTPLRVTLAQVLAQLGLAFAVKDDVLMISSPEGIQRGRDETVVLPRLLTPKTKAVLAQLDEPISMSFANETPLEDVLKYITQATTTATALGIPIVVDAFGLQEVEKKLQSTVTLDLLDVPLKTTLRLLLTQLGLVYTIKDGVVVISSPQVIQKLEKRTAEEPPGKTSPPPR